MESKNCLKFKTVATGEDGGHGPPTFPRINGGRGRSCANAPRARPGLGFVSGSQSSLGQALRRNDRLFLIQK